MSSPPSRSPNLNPSPSASPQYGVYNNTLVPYEETIQLQFDETGTVASLVLRNYREVFCQNPVSPEFEFPVVESKRLGKAPGGPGSRYKAYKPKDDEASNYLSIGILLDVVDVIRLQRGLIEAFDAIPGKEDILEASEPDQTAYTSCKTILHLLGLCLDVHCGMAAARDRFENLNFPLKNPAPTIQVLLARLFNRWDSRKYRVGSTDDPFDLFFPKPSLMFQEQRCKYRGGPPKRGQKEPPGQTKAFDIRLLDIVPYQQQSVRTPSQITNKEGKTYTVDPGRELRDLMMAFRKLGEQGETAAVKIEALFKHLSFLSGYAFHGSNRTPPTIQQSGGLLPQYCRTDTGLDKQKAAWGETLDKALKGKDEKEKKSMLEPFVKFLKKTLGREETEKEEEKDFIQLLAELNIFDLERFTFGINFKPFVSTTKSTAVAKAFSSTNEKIKLNDMTYCYVVHCQLGYEIPSFIPEWAIREIQKRGQEKPGLDDQFTAWLKEVTPVVNYPEQEITKFGALPFDKIVAYRPVHVSRLGERFCGPIFFRRRLLRQDPSAFVHLFQLLSGKSQGPGYEIYECYKNDDPDNPWKPFKAMGMNDPDNPGRPTRM